MQKQMTTDEIASLIEQEILTIQDAQDRMFAAVVDAADVTLDGAYAEVDRAVRKLKDRAQVLKQLAHPQRSQM